MDDAVVVFGVAAAPVVTALVAAIGQAVPALSRRWYPLIAIVLGVAWSSAVALAQGEFDWSAPLVGVVVGLAASGLYSGAVKPALASMRERS